jgi:hypothetical protein
VGSPFPSWAIYMCIHKLNEIQTVLNLSRCGARKFGKGVGRP